MAKYRSINNIGELKIIQNANPNEVFIGIHTNGFAFVFDGKDAKQLTRNQLKAALNLTPQQIDKVLKTRGKVQFDFSKEVSVGKKAVKPAIESKRAEKSVKKQTVVARNMDIPGGKEKSVAADAGVTSGKVSSLLKKDLKNAASLDKSNSRTISLKNRVKELSRRVEWLEKNTVTKEQMIQIVQSLTKTGE